jgi:hypothetical protein
MPRIRQALACGLLIAGVASAGVPASLHTEVDASIRPGDDFYGYANHAWLQATRLPEGASSIDSSSMLRALNAQRVRDLVASAVKARSLTPDMRKLADYYAARLDLAAIEAKGLAPLSSDLAAIAAIADRKALAAALGRSTRLDDGSNLQTESLWGIWVHQDFHDPDGYAAHLVQGGLGLPGPDDYLSPAPDRLARRALYRAYIATILKAGGFDQPDVRARRVLELETAIARTHASRADTDDVFKTDNGWHGADFAARAPGMDWPAFFAAAGLDSTTPFVVWQPGSMTGGARLVADARSTPGRTISPSTWSIIMRRSYRGTFATNAAPSMRGSRARRRLRRPILPMRRFRRQRQCSATRSASFMLRIISRRAPRLRRRRCWPISGSSFAIAWPICVGCRRRRARRLSSSSRRFGSGWAIPKVGSTMRPSRWCAAMHSAI